MAKNKKGGSDADFMAAMRGQPVSTNDHPGMIMTKPPVGPSKSIEEVLNAGADEVVSTVDVSEPAAIPHFLLKDQQRNLDSKFLPVSSIHRSEYQVRAVTDTDYIEQLMASIQQSGVISPIVVRSIAKGYEIIAGHHRFEACRRLGHAEVPVDIRTMTDAEAAIALTSDNFVRQELGAYERYKHLKMLMDKGFCKTGREVAAVLGISSSQVTQLRAFDAFPEGAKAILETHPGLLGSDSAKKLEEVARTEPELFIEALLQVAEGKLQQTKIAAWVEAKLKSGSLRLKQSRFIKISRPGLTKPIKLTYTDREAKIQAEGLNIEKLHKLIEDNLNDLMS